MCVRPKRLIISKNEVMTLTIKLVKLLYIKNGVLVETHHYELRIYSDDLSG